MDGMNVKMSSCPRKIGKKKAQLSLRQLSVCMKSMVVLKERSQMTKKLRKP